MRRGSFVSYGMAEEQGETFQKHGRVFAKAKLERGAWGGPRSPTPGGGALKGAKVKKIGTGWGGNGIH